MIQNVNSTNDSQLSESFLEGKIRKKLEKEF
jgi:hypothetical protein